MCTTQDRVFVEADLDLSLVVKRTGDFGFRLADHEELQAAVVMAEELIKGKIASVEAIQDMNDHTRMTAWVTGRPVDGIFLTIPLTASGERAVRSGMYNPAKPALEHLAKAGQGVSAFYVGVYAGLTREARKKIMIASAVLRMEVFAAYPAYARAATDDGRRSMESLGFEPYQGGLPDLYVQRPLQNMPGKAA